MINGLINDPDVPVHEIILRVKPKDSSSTITLTNTKPALEFYNRASSKDASQQQEGYNANGKTSSKMATDGPATTGVWQSANNSKLKTGVVNNKIGTTGALKSQSTGVIYVFIVCIYI